MLGASDAITLLCALKVHQPIAAKDKKDRRDSLGVDSAAGAVYLNFVNGSYVSVGAKSCFNIVNNSRSTSRTCLKLTHITTFRNVES